MGRSGLYAFLKLRGGQKPWIESLWKRNFGLQFEFGGLRLQGSERKELKSSCRRFLQGILQKPLAWDARVGELPVEGLRFRVLLWALHELQRL